MLGVGANGWADMEHGAPEHREGLECLLFCGGDEFDADAGAAEGGDELLGSFGGSGTLPDLSDLHGLRVDGSDEDEPEFVGSVGVGGQGEGVEPCAAELTAGGWAVPVVGAARGGVVGAQPAAGGELWFVDRGDGHG